MSPSSVIISRSAARSRSQMLVAVAHAAAAADTTPLGSASASASADSIATASFDYVWSIENEDGTRRVELKQQGVQQGNKIVQVVFDFDRDCVSFEQIEGGLYFATPLSWIAAPLRWIAGVNNEQGSGVDVSVESKLRLELFVTESDGVMEREVPTRVRRLVEVDDLSAAPSVVAAEDDLSGAPMQIDSLACSDSSAITEEAVVSVQEQKQIKEEAKYSAIELKSDPVVDAPITLPRTPAESPTHHSATICDEDVLHTSVELLERADQGARIEPTYEEQSKLSVESPELSQLIQSITPRPLKHEIETPYQPSLGRVLAGVSLVGMLAPAGSILLGVMARNIMA